MINQVEEIMEEPSYKKFESKRLTSYVLNGLVADLRLDSNKATMLDSIKYLTTLSVTSTYFVSAMEKLYFQEPYISEGSTKLYGEESVFDMIKSLENDKAAGPIFMEFIFDKNGDFGEVECLKLEFFDNAVVELKSLPLAN